jgi:D-3-phosphoglycerate dehydrogenase
LSSAGIEDWFEAGVIDRSRNWTAAKGVYAAAIAEYVLTMMLAASRRLPEVLRTPGWQPRDVSSLLGATIGVVGAGGIGEALLQLLLPFGTRSIALTRGGRTVPGATESVDPDGLDRLLSRADYVVLAAPETPETVGLLSRSRLKLLQTHAWIINVGRGSIIDTDALVDALEHHRLGGAVLDVTSPEPLPDEHPLWRLPNAIITSHTASTPRLGRDHLSARIQANVNRFARGEELLGLVDVDLGY